MTVFKNPCLPCNTCCTLKGLYGLRLSQDEFDQYFKGHEQNLIVRVEDKMVVISSKEGEVCPHLGKDGCRIYLNRPVDCRLYPYQMELVFETPRKVKFIFHSQSDCPRKEYFLVSDTEAKALITEFGRKVYGDKKIIVQKYTDSFLLRLKNKCELTFIRFCKKINSQKEFPSKF